MFTRKLYAAGITSLLMIIFLVIYTFINSVVILEELVFLPLWVAIAIVPSVFIYGYISSLLAEVVAKKISRFEIGLSFIGHVLFGALFIFIYNIFFDRNINVFYEFGDFWDVYSRLGVIAIITAIVFWVADSILKKSKKIRFIF